MSWTEERIQTLTNLWEDGLSASEIGKVLGVSKNAVVGKAHRLKLASRPSPIKRDGESKRRRRNAALARARMAESVQAPTVVVEIEADEAITPLAPALERKQANESRHQCAWPIGDPSDPSFRFCGEPALPGKPYCAKHCAVAYISKNKAESAVA